MNISTWSHCLINLLALLICVNLTRCISNDQANTLQDGRDLAQKHCVSCHLFPEPALLDKHTWTEQVLPAMAVRFGIEVLEGNIYLHSKDAALSSKEWSAIKNYYQTLAPDSLIQPKTAKPKEDWASFQLITPEPDLSQTAATIMVAVDKNAQTIYTSGLNSPFLYQWNKQMRSKAVVELPSSAVDMFFPDDINPKTVLTSMGGMRAMDNTKGNIFEINNRKGSEGSKTEIGSGFIRPVQTRAIDYNKDGLTDYVVCAFGHNVGGLYILEQQTNNSFKRIPVREMPGATQTEIGDFDNDGWPDIMALFAHAEEGIWLFLNDHKGGFISTNLLQFPSVYGSSSFQLVDINGDGKQDIIYTAGDNSDYSRILKPYHGVYVFLNEGNMQFKKSFFYPMHGATKAMAADFDQDGDNDIAVIAFFADFKSRPNDTFLYFENLSSGKSTLFQPHAIPISQYGRWICMDVKDLDGDGDADIVLGNYSKGFMNQENFKPTWDTHVPFVILKNIRK